MRRAALRGFIAASLVTATLAAASPAHADAVEVRFGVSAGHYLPATYCIVEVPQGATGTDVLDAAVDAYCIEGYQMDGSWLECVTIAAEPICSQVHEDPLCCGTHYWAIYEDLGAFSPHALSGFSAGNPTHARLMGEVDVEHTELLLSFESWTKCLGFIVTELWPLCHPDF